EAMRRSGGSRAEAPVRKRERSRERRGHREVDVRLGPLLRLGNQAWMERAVRMALRVEARELREVDEARARDAYTRGRVRRRLDGLRPRAQRKARDPAGNQQQRAPHPQSPLFLDQPLLIVIGGGAARYQ